MAVKSHIQNKVRSAKIAAGPPNKFNALFWHITRATLWCDAWSAWLRCVFSQGTAVWGQNYSHNLVGLMLAAHELGGRMCSPRKSEWSIEGHHEVLAVFRGQLTRCLHCYFAVRSALDRACDVLRAISRRSSIWARVEVDRLTRCIVGLPCNRISLAHSLAAEQDTDPAFVRLGCREDDLVVFCIVNSLKSEAS